MARVIHVLADGKVVDSIQGRVVPTTGPTEIVYKIVMDALKEQRIQENRITKSSDTLGIVKTA